MRGVFRAVVRVVVPASVGFDEARWVRVEQIVRDALAERPPAVARRVTLFLRVLDAFARARSFRGFASLPNPKALRLLQALERSPLLLLRRGVWGVRTLAFMGCYADDQAGREIGYGVALSGWEARGRRQGDWPDRAGAAPPEPGVLPPASNDTPDA